MGLRILPQHDAEALMNLCQSGLYHFENNTEWENISVYVSSIDRKKGSWDMTARIT